MELVPLKPRRGEGTLRINDSDDFVVIESVGAFPSNGLLPESGVYIENHGVIIVCTEGMAQFEYDGQTIQLRKNDMFIYVMLRSVISNFMSSQNFNCRQIWFTASEAWNVDMHGSKNLADHLMFLKQHPKVSLSDQDAAVFDDYFQLLCRRMRDRTPMLYVDIVRSLFSTMLLEVMDMVRRDMMVGEEQNVQPSRSRWNWPHRTTTWCRTATKTNSPCSPICSMPPTCVCLPKWTLSTPASNCSTIFTN